MRKFIIFLKLHWVKLLVISIFLTILMTVGLVLFDGAKNFLGLESFTRKQISAQMGYTLLIFIFVSFIQVPLFFGMHMYLMQGGGLGKMGNEKMMKAEANIKWDQVIGMEGAKKEAWELIKLLKDRSLLKVIGGKIVKGTLFIGPPGCGKTYLAKAIATECGMAMISSTGSDFVGMIVGQGAAQMKSLFAQARAIAKMDGGCIIFIDEIDAFATPRQADRGFGGQLSHNATINQFLTEMDGLRQTENNIVVFAATNSAEDQLDSAITRSGRFDRKLYFSRPNLQERTDLFKFYLSRVKTDAGIDADILARKALYFTPADIDNMVREAGLFALRDNRDTLSFKDLSQAYDRIAFGMKSNIVMSEKEKIWTAYHETGHAVIAYMTHPTNDVIKATIVPHKGSLGFVSQRPTEELHSSNKEHLLANIKVSLASYVAEKLKFGSTSSGVGGGRGSDFDTAMRIAHAMVWQFGMGKSGLIGDFDALTGHGGESYISEKTKEILDHDVQDILQTCLREIEETLTKNRELLEYFAQELLKKEELEYDEIEAIFKKFGAASGRPLPVNRSTTA